MPAKPWTREIKNRSTIQPDTLYADTQGQSEPVFGLCRLLGIMLMPRKRDWDDVIFYRPGESVRYQHIDALFSKEIDWRLIETHWRDMMQVVLSIQAGLVLPSMLLRKLGSLNRKSRLWQGFRELGRAERTLFLLRYISNWQIRRTIRAETTKIESFNDFLDWITFGGPIIKSDDPVEQEKQLKYATLAANSIMRLRPDRGIRIHGQRRTPCHSGSRRCDKPLHAQERPALREIRPRHGRTAGTAQPQASTPRNALVTTFYTYPQLDFIELRGIGESVCGSVP